MLQCSTQDPNIRNPAAYARAVAAVTTPASTHARPADATAATRQLNAYLSPPMPAGGWRGWIGPITVTLLAAALRLPSLGRPNELVFDETYYVKDALGMLRYGTEQKVVEGADELILAAGGDVGVDIFTGEGSYVVHPPLGKWIIAAGEALFGVSPQGWRMGMLIVGLIAVFVLTRIARRLLRSNAWATVAGLLLAVDGLAIVMSRTALLDNALMLFVLAAFAALLIDRDQIRAKVTHQLPTGWYPGAPGGVPTVPWLRGWRIVAALLLGAACAVKWSGLWFVAVFGILTVVWDLNLRRSLGDEHPWLRTTVAALPTAAVWVTAAAVVYVASWWGWFTTDTGYFRQWATNQPGSLGPVIDTLRSWWHYHGEVWRFHTGLTTEHSYAASAFGWPLQARPTAFFYDGEVACAAAKCSQAVLALGNPLIWWGGLVALAHQTWRAVARRDWVAGAVVVAFLAGWAPWLLYQDRPIFFFYSIVFLPYLILAGVLSVQVVTARLSQPTRSATVAGLLVIVLTVSWFFYPIWVGEPMPYEQWRLRMWLPSWV